MSEVEQITPEVEQITKTPEKQAEKIKNPARVAAGKRLVEYHKRAKQALKEQQDLHQQGDDVKSGWMPEISLTTGLTLVGIGLTAVELYFRFKKQPSTLETKETNEISESNECASHNLQQKKGQNAIKRIGME